MSLEITNPQDSRAAAKASADWDDEPRGARGARLWSQTRPQRLGSFKLAAAGALHTAAVRFAAGWSLLGRMTGRAMVRLLERFRIRTRRAAGSTPAAGELATFLLVAALGFLDYVTGPEFAFSIFYLLPIAFGAWCISQRAGILACIAGALTWLLVDTFSGTPYSHWTAPYWNALVRLGFFLIVVLLLSALKRATATMEETVRQKTALLTAEIREREQVQRQLIDSKEAEQRRLARELHDGLCQFLTGTALKAKSLQAALVSQDNRYSIDAAELVSLLNEGVAQANRLAKGFDPLELESGNLTSALEQLSGQSGRLFGVRCVFKPRGPLGRLSRAAMLHLYRIAQEAIHNAIRHGRAHQITLSVRPCGESVSLTIDDDGLGFAPDQQPPADGMGLRTMQYRANIVGGTLEILSCPGQGTRVHCIVPRKDASSANGERSSRLLATTATKAEAGS